jgi:hypothetical protein
LGQSAAVTAEALKARAMEKDAIFMFDELAEVSASVNAW